MVPDAAALQETAEVLELPSDPAIISRWPAPSVRTRRRARGRRRCPTRRLRSRCWPRLAKPLCKNASRFWRRLGLTCILLTRRSAPAISTSAIELARAAVEGGIRRRRHGFSRGGHRRSGRTLRTEVGRPTFRKRRRPSTGWRRCRPNPDSSCMTYGYCGCGHCWMHGHAATTGLSRLSRPLSRDGEFAWLRRAYQMGVGNGVME